MKYDLRNEIYRTVNDLISENTTQDIKEVVESNVFHDVLTSFPLIFGSE